MCYLYVLLVFSATSDAAPAQPVEKRPNIKSYGIHLDVIVDTDLTCTKARGGELHPSFPWPAVAAAYNFAAVRALSLSDPAGMAGALVASVSTRCHPSGASKLKRVRTILKTANITYSQAEELTRLLGEEGGYTRFIKIVRRRLIGKLAAWGPCGFEYTNPAYDVVCLRNPPPGTASPSCANSAKQWIQLDMEADILIDDACRHQGGVEPSTCFDGVQTAGEVGVDCGGTCKACPGQPCSTAAECHSRQCDNATQTCSYMECTRWACSTTQKGTNTPTRLNADGEIECMSLDQASCLWSSSCETLVANPPPGALPFVCGSMHYSVYGGTGYGQPGHWCTVKRELCAECTPTDLSECSGDANCKGCTAGVCGANPSPPPECTPNQSGGRKGVCQAETCVVA